MGMNRYWRKFPPAHICLKAGFGLEVKEPEPVNTFDDFVRDFIGAGGKIGGIK